ncbi:TetR/AcrR family transcriptional regulator [Actinomyces culturomici]|uniref:TetR/AcrR family transcriptional regulator n=1 Tax=Actinomyces culturomici TaxID=1926276 RepID=UPI000E204F05|nr:TetR/AcrR family transcriptional regulator C-terminal domain-containing protein [Actinomyces culturomici]
MGTAKDGQEPPSATTARKRTKGRPPRIDAEKIVEAARTLPPERVTMQGVAEVLGVDPTALNYHVGGRAGFMRLVALDRARTAAARFAAEPTEGPWDERLRAFAVAMRTSIGSIGPLAPHLEYDSSAAFAYMGPIERILEALVEAGFDLETAARALTLVAHAAVHAGKADARARARSERDAGPHRGGTSFLAFAAQSPDDFPLIHRLVSGEVGGLAPRENWSSDRQFDFEIDAILAGLRALLDAR